MSGDAPTTELSGWRARVLAHLRSGQVSKVVYGSIIGLALVLTLEVHPPGVGAIIGTLIGTGFAVSLAEFYSELIGARTQASLGEEHEPMSVIIEDAVAVTLGVAFPAIFFVLSALGVWKLDTAFEVAKWTGLGLIAGYGYLAARISGSSVGRALLQASGVALIAAALIAFKAILH